MKINVVKNTKFNTLKTKVNNLEKKIPDVTISVPINQLNTDKQTNKKIRDVDERMPYLIGSVYTLVLNTKISLNWEQNTSY